MANLTTASVALLAGTAGGACLAQSAPVPGEPKPPRTIGLEAGAKVLQASAPLKPFDMHLVGFHPMKEHPEQQMEAHHYCHQMNEDFSQCTLFDSSARNARLNGIEYLISEKLFESLPAAERAFWHPHNGEILSDQLTAPDQLPLGPAMLAWSFSRDGEAIPAMVERRDRRLGINSNEPRKQRAELQKLARPQSGVDALKGKFARPGKDLPGVVAQPAPGR